MRRLAAAFLLLLCCVALASCGSTSSHPHLWVTPGAPPHLLTACGAPDCGPYAANLRWDLTIPGVVGYNVFVNGTQVGQTSVQFFSFFGLDCGVNYLLGVQAFDGSGHSTPIATVPFAQACTAPAAPTNVVAPSIVGTPAQGQTLSANVGTWANAPTSFTYQWQECSPSAGCNPVVGATNPTFALTAPDVNDALYVTVTASNSQGKATLTSGASSPIDNTTGFGTTYFVSSSSGSDSNNGTTKSTPWAHAPGMASCTATCASTTIAAGSRIILKGGDTWTAANFPVDPKAGATGAWTYYGVDPTWFTGTSYTSPFFDDQYNLSTGCGTGCTTSTSFFSPSTNGQMFYVIDGISMKDFQWQGNPGFQGSAYVFMNANNVIENSTLDNWQHGTGCCDFSRLLFAHDNNLMILHNTLGPQQEGQTINDSMTGVHGLGSGVIDHNAFSDMVNMALPGQGSSSGAAFLSNNTFANPGASDYDGTSHGNTVEDLGNPGFYFYNNIVHGVQSGSGEFVLDYPSGSVNYVYNNVFYDINGLQAAITAENNAFGSGFAQFLYNNTCADVGACIQWARTGSVTATVKNTHLIGAGALTQNDGATCSCTITNTLTQTDAAAGAQGYLAGNNYMPTSGTGSTVGAGANQSATCSATGALSLCWGAEGNPRPSGSAAWDAGAYQFSP